MIPEPWLYAAVGIVLLVQLIALAYARTAGGDLGKLRAVSAGEDGRVSGGSVECPGCGTENERGYRFCRSCLTELPGSAGRTRRTVAPTGRRIE